MTSSITYDSEQTEKSATASQLPEPSGFRMLIALPEVSESTESGIYLPDERRNAESVASIVGFVLKQGLDCYADKDRFPNGPWCKEGDWIVMRSYAGTRLVIHGKEFRLINDDSVEAVVEDPRGISRAGG
jgi:co-chaperonin GroES (HSP10)|tara:strand:+ start:1425 stop:1814 length:390 start_codon:yes stop_codon:yes gene_type:complete